MNSSRPLRLNLAVAVIGLIGSLVLPASPLGIFAATSPCPGAATTCLYVSPKGDDRNDGTFARPVRTLGRARDLVRGRNRNMHGNIIVYLADGTYRLTHALVLGPQDSGTNGYTVTWTELPGAQPLISGARRIYGWRLSDKSKGIWSAPVPTSLRTRQIYVNDVRASMAAGRLPLRLTQTRYGYTAPSSALSRWRNPSDIEFAYPYEMGQMAEPICPVASIKGTTITMAQPCWDNSTLRLTLSSMKPYYNNDLVAPDAVSLPTYAEDAFELLQHPGQFYLDTSAHMLYYIPRAGEDMSTADVETPTLQTLVVGKGSANTPVHGITFSGLQFSYATWLQPSSPEGFSEVQAGYTITGKNGIDTQGLCQLAPHGSCPYGAWTKEPGNISFTYDRNISFVNDRFVHLGAAALNLGNGSQGDTIAGSVFTDISGNGIELGGVNLPEATGADQTMRDSILDNHLYDLPVEYHGGVAILVGYVANSTISHNQIDHVSYSAISMGWGGWLLKAGLPAVPNYSHDNVVSDNLIYDYLQVMNDGGGIYTQGITGNSMTDGEKVTGNVIHDLLDWGAGLKPDNGAAFISETNNALYNDIYDWDPTHWDGPRTPSTFGPELVRDNFWQQGDLDTSGAGTTLTGNTTIGGPGQIPASILANAGIQPKFRFILAWRPWGQLVPDAPYSVQVIEAYRGVAFATIHPSLTSSVVAYTLTACQVVTIAGEPTCSRSGPDPVTLSAGDLYRRGYAVVSGLLPGREYTFSAVANASGRSSTPSLPTSVLWGPSSPPPPLSGPPRNVWVNAGANAVTLGWYRPSGSPDHSGPVLRYVVTGSGGRTYSLPGQLQLSTNGGGKMLTVVGGLTTGRKYTFSISAVNATGLGPPATISVTTP